MKNNHKKRPNPPQLRWEKENNSNPIFIIIIMLTMFCVLYIFCGLLAQFYLMFKG